MLIKSYDTFIEAKNDAIAYCKSAKFHSGLRDKKYRIYHYHDSYKLWSGYTSRDFPSKYGYIVSYTSRTV